MRADIFVRDSDIESAGDGLIHVLHTGDVSVTLGKYRESITLFIPREHAKTIANRILDALRGDDEVVEVEPRPEVTVDSLGVVRYMLNGKRHREDGPAFIDGDHQAWWLNGQRHRVDGPAVIDGDRQEWWLNGERHRVDGPAFIDGDRQEWYLNGQRMSEEQHAELVAAMTVDEVL